MAAPPRWRTAAMARAYMYAPSFSPRAAGATTSWLC
jgi:hypothetical protein